jgi:hypothetical protein
MINAYFFLKFRSQLRRTRPDIVRQFDESLDRAIADAGGKITGDRTIITAVFNEETIGFWLDIYILIENVKRNIDISKEFFGYSLVITGKSPEAPEQLCRFLADNNNGGIFLDSNAAKKLIPYVFVEKPSVWLKIKNVRKYGCENFYRINEIKILKPFKKNNLDLQKDVLKILEETEAKNTLILGPVFSLMRNGMFKYCNKLNDDFPPLSICFGSIGIGALVDSWSGSIRSLSDGQSTDEIDNLWELLFRERIRDEVSDFIVRSVKRFLSLLFSYYFNAAKKKKRRPVLLLENVHLAGKITADLLLDSLAAIDDVNRKNLLILGTGEDDILPEKLEQWETIFKKIKKIKYKDQKQINIQRLPMDLWEIVYAISLFSYYFSPELFQRLFEEDDKNPIMIIRAFSILHSLGVIDNLREPRLVNRCFEDYARKVLGDKTARVKASVCKRLLSWAEKRNISPCFRLLTVLDSLDGVKQIDDLLLLKSVTSDIINETISGIESAIKNGQLEELVKEKAEPVKYIFKTSRALYTGDEKDIENTFKENNVDYENFPVLKAQTLVNFCSYYLGKHDKNLASERAKEAILFGQNKNTFCLPQAYRLFSLVCLTKQQAVESIEYLKFALSNVEKTGNYNEMGISAYYAAAVQFLFGDIYNSQLLARKSVEQSIAAGRPEWADRSRFLEGRLNFELGHYREAHNIFEALRKEPFGSRNDERDNLLDAWIYRSKIYFSSIAILKPETVCHDAELFEIEASYLAGNYQKVVELSDSLNNPFLEEKFLYTEQPDWSSGFSQCEHLYFSKGEIQNRMICLFKSLALSRLSPEKSEEIIQNLQQILRGEKLCEMDPWDAFYFYAKYRILENAGANLVDLSTAVSMAFKRLQRRAGRIEDIETRRQYMNGSRWNRELSIAAKNFKLI